MKQPRETHAAEAEPFRARAARIATIDRKLSDLVLDACVLTPEERALLVKTAPPRMTAGPG